MKLLMSVPFCDAASIKQVIKHKPKSVKLLVYEISALLLWGGSCSASYAVTCFVSVRSFTGTYLSGINIPIADRTIFQYDRASAIDRHSRLVTILNEGTVAALLAQHDPSYCNYHTSLSSQNYPLSARYDHSCYFASQPLKYSTDSTICNNNEPYSVWETDSDFVCSTVEPNQLPPVSTQPPPE